MEKQLTLKEKFLLISYQPKNGNPYPATQYHFGFIGACLMELAALGKVKTVGKLLKLNDSKNTGDKALDFMIGYFIKAGKDKKIAYWLRKFSEFGTKRKLRLLILEELIQKRILSEAQGRVLFIFKYKKYPARETRTRDGLIRSIRSLVLRQRDDEKDTLLLAALVGACRMTNKLFEKKDRKQANKKIKILLKENKMAEIVDETVAAVQAAIVATIITSTVVTGAGSH